MKIKNITIENYRGIKEEQTIPFGDFSTIVGKNDTGKSILIHAIASFLDKSYSISKEDFNDESKPITIIGEFEDEKIKDILKEHLKTEKDTGIEEFIDDVLQDNVITIQKIINSPKSKTFDTINILTNDIDKPEFSDLYNKKATEIEKIVKTYSIKIPVEGTGNNSLYEKIKYIKEFCLAQGYAKKKIFLEDAKDCFQILPSVELFAADNAIDVDTSFKSDSLSEISSFFKGNTELNDLETKITNQLNQEADQIKNYMKDYVANVDTIEMVPEYVWNKAVNNISIKLKCSNDMKGYPLSHKGSGYRRLFMVARLRYLAEREEKFNAIYLIEEPETFLHPSAQEDLIDAFSNLAEENQVIITTHSPIFAGATEKSSIILAQKQDQSIYSTIQNYHTGDDFISIIVQELGIKPYYNPQEVSKILFVESNNDREFYNFVCKKLLSHDLINDRNILVLPGGGDNLSSLVNIEYFERSGKKLFLILDSDKQNTQEKIDLQKRRRDDFNIKPNSKAFLLNKSCIENYYHPRAIERLYNITQNSISFFNEDANVKEELRTISQTHSVQIALKNNFAIFQAMTDAEWREVIEPELVNFLTEVIS